VSPLRTRQDRLNAFPALLRENGEMSVEDLEAEDKRSTHDQAMKVRAVVTAFLVWVMRGKKRRR